MFLSCCDFLLSCWILFWNSLSAHSVAYVIFFAQWKTLKTLLCHQSYSDFSFYLHRFNSKTHPTVVFWPGVSIPLSHWFILHIPPYLNFFINSPPHLLKIDKFPPYFCSIGFFANLRFFPSPYFDHDAFMHYDQNRGSMHWMPLTSEHLFCILYNTCFYYRSQHLWYIYASHFTHNGCLCFWLCLPDPHLIFTSAFRFCFFYYVPVNNFVPNNF